MSVRRDDWNTRRPTQVILLPMSWTPEMLEAFKAQWRDLTEETLARALPMHHYDDTNIKGHESCLDEARAILRNLRR